jgi:hypothetical protein
MATGVRELLASFLPPAVLLGLIFLLPPLLADLPVSCRACALWSGGGTHLARARPRRERGSGVVEAA